MNILYYSMTGNNKSFLAKTNYKDRIESIQNIDHNINEPFILVTSTVNFGEVPKPVQKFLDRHSQYLKAVVSSGNRNWGQNFGRAGDVISKKYNVPLLMKFEMRGTTQSVNEFNERMEKFEKLQSCGA